MDATTIKGQRGRDVLLELVNGQLVLTPVGPNGVGTPIRFHEEQIQDMIDVLEQARLEAHKYSVAAVQRLVLGAIGTDGPD